MLDMSGIKIKHTMLTPRLSSAFKTQPSVKSLKFKCIYRIYSAKAAWNEKAMQPQQCFYQS